MTTVRKILFCEPCAYKEIVKEEEIGDEYKSVPDVPGGAPRLDPVTKKVVDKKGTKRNKRRKCPKCGRGVFLKKLPIAYEKTIKDIEKREEEAFQKHERDQRLQDGKPLEETAELIKEREAQELVRRERERKFKDGRSS